MALRLHRHEHHRLRLPLEPAVEGGKANSALAHPEDLPVGPRLTIPTAGRDMVVRPPMSIPIVVIRALSFRGPQGCPLAPVDVS